MNGTLERTIMLVHCGEPDAVVFCQRLKDVIGDTRDGFRIVEVDCTASLGLAGPNDLVTRSAHRYLRSFDLPEAVYDRVLAHPGPLLRTPVPLAVFCMTAASFKSRLFRNAFVHHNDAAGLRPGVNCIPVLFDIDYAALRELASSDEHLLYTLRRAYLVLDKSEVAGIAALMRAVLDELTNDRARWRMEKRTWTVGRSLVALSFISQRISSLLLVPLIVISLLALLGGASTAASVVGSAAAFLAALVLGLRLADVPATPAFAEHRQDAALRLQKALRHVRALRVPAAVWALVAVIYGTSLCHVAMLVAGILLGITEQRWRYTVFQLRLRLAGAENYAEHMAGRIVPIIAEVAPSRVLPRLRFDADADWPVLWPILWDLYSMQVAPFGSRTLLRPGFRVFVSYVWQHEDRRFALDLVRVMKAANIPHFFDRDQLKRGLPWRSRIAVEISRASHFVLVLSSRTPMGETCAHEARQALACLPLSAWPRILVCLLEPDDQILAVGGDAVFRYLHERAERVRPEELLNSESLLDCLRRTAPEGYLGDCYRNAPPLVFRSGTS